MSFTAFAAVLSHRNLPFLLLSQVEAHPALLAEGETPKYPPISGRDYLLAKLKAAHEA